jgi:hypothetical protein
VINPHIVSYSCGVRTQGNFWQATIYLVEAEPGGVSPHFAAS